MGSEPRRRKSSDGRRAKGARTRGSGRLSAAAIAVEKRRREALEYRIQGYGFQAIGNALGISTTRAFQLVSEGLSELTREPAERLREIEAERLDMMTTAFFPNAVQGDLGAAAVVLKIMERRAKLLGLDAPARHEVTGKDGRAVEVTVADAQAARAALLAALLRAGLTSLEEASET